MISPSPFTERGPGVEVARPTRLTPVEQITGAGLLARALKGHGVHCIFSLSGDVLTPLYDACLDEGIRIVDFRHEQAAVHAADAWARCRPG